MTRAFPFLRPPIDVVTASPWSRSVTDGVEPLPDVLVDWDYDTTLSLQRTVVIDGVRARLLAGLHEASTLDLSVHWYATTSALRGRVWRAAVPATDATDLHIELDLPGTDLGGALELTTSLTLRTSAPGASPAAPRRPGSILWSDRQQALLQGDVSLFPIATADFHDLPYPTGASWYLHVDEDLESAALGAMLLLVNERREVVVRALAAAAAPTESDRLVLSVLRSDVSRVLVERALAHDDLDEETEYPPGSVGALFSSVLRSTFPAAFTLDALRRERRTSPALFSSRLQEATDLLSER